MACGECKYLGWNALVKTCRHPLHPRPIPRWPYQCREFVSIDSKVMAGQSSPWPDPVGRPDA